MRLPPNVSRSDFLTLWKNIIRDLLSNWLKSLDLAYLILINKKTVQADI